MDNKYSLTYPQKNIWMVEEFFGKSPINTIVGLFYINYGFNFDLCEKVVNKMVELNDALRIRTYKDNSTGEVYQKIEDYKYFLVDFFDLTKLNKSKEELNSEVASVPFSVIGQPLYYFAVVKTGEDSAYILVKLHHLIADAWTYSNVATFLARFLEDMGSEDCQPSYIEYIESEKQYVLSDRFKVDKEFWNEYLYGLSENVGLKEEPDIIDTTAKRYTVCMDKELNTLVKDYCKVNRVSPYSVFMSAVAIYINRVTEKKDFVIGTPVLNRSNAKEKKMFGMFVSTMPVRFKIDDKLTFSDMCKSSARESMTLFRHQKYPYSLILQDFKDRNDLKTNLYSVMVSYQNARFDRDEEEKAKYTTDWVVSGRIQNELEIHITDMDETGTLQVHFDYLEELFEENEIKLIVDRIFTIIQDGIVKNSTIEEISIMSDSEKRKILDDFNNTKSYYPDKETVISLFEKQVKENPDKVALVFEKEEITYAKLNERATKVADLLIRYGIKPADAVGLMQSKSPKIVECMLGILKLGAIYVPMDPNATLKTKRHVIKTSKIKVILSDVERAEIDNTSVIKVDYQMMDRLTLNNNETVHGNIDDVNSIMFTSGTTGIPKGVMITNRNIIKLVKNSNYITFNMDDKMLQTGSFTFDASTLEVWNGLLNGIPLYMVKNELLDPKLFENFIRENGITVIFLTSALFNQMISYNPNMFEHVRVIMTGGESMSKEHAMKLLSVSPDIILKNLYGPTENAVVSTYYNVNPKDKVIPIGKPLSNTKCFILDSKLRLLPIGVKGILYLAGDGLSKGYCGNSELTNEKFIESEYGRIYDTGDIALYRCDGNIDFFGRKDSEVKIKGMRVDLHEIKDIVNRFSHVQSSELLCMIDGNGNKYLGLVIVSAQEEDKELLKNYLKNYIPIHVIPRKIIQLDKMPLTANGKVDYKKIEKIFKNNIMEMSKEVKFEGIYLQLYNLFKEVLEISDIGMDDDFFDIGGDSILAISVVSKAVEKGINLTYDELYKCRTIRELGDVLNSNKKRESKSQEISEYDYTSINNLLNKGMVSNGECRNVILAGATGFLGMHILTDYIDNFDGNIYCLVRDSNNVDAKTRFIDRMRFYFKDKYDCYIDKRIFVVPYNGELDKNKLEKVETKGVTHFINSLALVKHFGNTDEFFKVNVETVDLISEFCIEHNIELIHISTLSVSGDIVENAKKLEQFKIQKKDYNEKCFYVGQTLDNVYALTKFLAERVILEKMVKGSLNARILRMGNLSDRYSDGKFQINDKDNAFSQRLKSLIAMGVLPEEIKTQKIDFTPVDIAARSVNSILKSTNENIVYHLYDSNKICIDTIVEKINAMGVKLKFVDSEEVSETIKSSIDNGKQELLRGIMVDISERNKLKYITDVNVTNEITNNVLNSLGFKWPEIDDKYLEQFIGRLIKKG